MFQQSPLTLRNTPSGRGLIAEEVAEVYPDLVTYSPTGAVETVRYDQLSVLLLNELQQHRQIEEQRQEIHELQKLGETMQKLSARMAELEVK